MSIGNLSLSVKGEKVGEADLFGLTLGASSRKDSFDNAYSRYHPEILNVMAAPYLAFFPVESFYLSYSIIEGFATRVSRVFGE